MTTPPVSLFVTTSTVPWVERRPGVFWKVLWEEGPHKAILMRYEPGATIPRHRHIGDCTAGNYARRPPGCVHTVTSPTGALVVAITSGPTEPV